MAVFHVLETAGVRAALIANFQASPVTVTTTGTFTATMSKQDLADKSLADALAPGIGILLREGARA